MAPLKLNAYTNDTTLKIQWPSVLLTKFMTIHVLAVFVKISSIKKVAFVLSYRFDYTNRGGAILKIDLLKFFYGHI